MQYNEIKEAGTASIGYFREDGDFRLLATLSNIDDDIETDAFLTLVKHTVNTYKRLLDDDSVIALARQDADDYLTIDE